MTCSQVRRMLAVYRRDDWSPAELDSFGAHIAACAECRRVEASFRSVGESVRQLPSIIPPESLRERVFAAIREESAERMPALTRLTNDETQPKLQVVPGRPSGSRRPRIVLGTPAAIAVAAVLLFSLVGARLVPAIAHGLPSIAASLANIAPYNLSQPGAPRIARYSAPAGSGPVSSALASPQWVVYVAGKNAGERLYATNRATKRAVALTAPGQAGPMSVLGLSDHWVLWMVGDGSSNGVWTLSASPLPAGRGATPGQPEMLASSADSSGSAPGLLVGTWITGDMALAAMITHSGETQLVRFDIATGQSGATSRVVARGNAGHVFSDPAYAGTGGVYYWADAWADSNGALHSDIWRGNGAGQTTAVTTNGAAFAPRLSGTTLMTVAASGPILLDPTQLSAGVVQAIRAVLPQVGGPLYTQVLGTGKSQLVYAHAMAGSLAVTDTLVVWRDGGQVHTYDLGRRGPSAVDRDVRGASFAGTTSTALAWGEPNSTIVSVYDHA